MDNNKLYNALLKTQERHRAERTVNADSAEADPIEPVDVNHREQVSRDPQMEQRKLRQADVGEQRRSERPFPEPDPNWTIVEDRESQYAPSVYDASVSLGLINNPRPWSEQELRERKIIYPGMDNRAILDAFREVRIKLRDQAGAANFSVLVSSLGKEDDSVLTAFNLATTFAMDAQSSALLVDCNPWDSDLEHLVSSPMNLGVTDFVADNSLKVRDIIYPSGVDRLSVVPAGTKSASAVELFSAVRMRDLMGELRTRYPDRFLIINAPPIKASTEAHILVRYANQVVMSVPFGEVTPDDIVSSVDTLGSEKFSGLIFQQ